MSPPAGEEDFWPGTTLRSARRRMPPPAGDRDRELGEEEEPPKLLLLAGEGDGEHKVDYEDDVADNEIERDVRSEAPKGEGRGSTWNRSLSRPSIRLGLPNVVIDLIRPGTVPFGRGLRAPPSRAHKDDANEGDGNNRTAVSDVTMNIVEAIHHGENTLQYAPKLSVRFHAVDPSTGESLPLATDDASRRPSESSPIASSEDGNLMRHEIHADFAVDCGELLSGDALLLFEVAGVGAAPNHRRSRNQRKAWGFFRPKRSLAKSLSDGDDDGSRLDASFELQLYKWRKESLLIRKQAEHHVFRRGQRSSVPEVFLQYLIRRRKKYNSCLCLRFK